MLPHGAFKKFSTTIAAFGGIFLMLLTKIIE